MKHKHGGAKNVVFWHNEAQKTQFYRVFDRELHSAQ
jgi:hypothetical protein